MVAVIGVLYKSTPRVILLAIWKMFRETQRNHLVLVYVDIRQNCWWALRAKRLLFHRTKASCFLDHPVPLTLHPATRCSLAD